MNNLSAKKLLISQSKITETQSKKEHRSSRTQIDNQIPTLSLRDFAIRLSIDIQLYCYFVAKGLDVKVSSAFSNFVLKVLNYKQYLLTSNNYKSLQEFEEITQLIGSNLQNTIIDTLQSNFEEKQPTKYNEQILNNLKTITLFADISRIFSTSTNQKEIISIEEFGNKYVGTKINNYYDYIRPNQDYISLRVTDNYIYTAEQNVAEIIKLLPNTIEQAFVIFLRKLIMKAFLPVINQNLNNSLQEVVGKEIKLNLNNSRKGKRTATRAMDFEILQRNYLNLQYASKQKDEDEELRKIKFKQMEARRSYLEQRKFGSFALDNISDTNLTNIRTNDSNKAIEIKSSENLLIDSVIQKVLPPLEAELFNIYDTKINEIIMKYHHLITIEDGYLQLINEVIKDLTKEDVSIFISQHVKVALIEYKSQNGSPNQTLEECFFNQQDKLSQIIYVPSKRSKKPTNTAFCVSKEITGSYALLDTLANHGVTSIFGYPGGAILPIYDELYFWEGKGLLSHYLVRHEQAAVHAADGYARSTGAVGVCFATSGPGATNLVTGIATAYMDSIPMLVVTGQVPSYLLGTDAFQEVDMFGVTLPIVKHSYVIKDANDINRCVAEAFYVAQHGRPGPVVIDIPKDMGAQALPLYDPIQPQHIAKILEVRFKTALFSEQLYKALVLLSCSRRPLLYIGGGAIKATYEINYFQRLFNIPITNTLMGKGIYSENAPLSVGMLGMHGTAYANFTVNNCDLLIALGARFDDRVTGKVSTFAGKAKIIHIDVDAAEINKNKRINLGISGHVKVTLQNLIVLVLEHVQHRLYVKNTQPWAHQVSIWKKRYSLLNEVKFIETEENINDELDRTLIASKIRLENKLDTGFKDSKINSKSVTIIPGQSQSDSSQESAIQFELSFAKKIIDELQKEEKIAKLARKEQNLLLYESYGGFIENLTDPEKERLRSQKQNELNRLKQSLNNSIMQNSYNTELTAQIAINKIGKLVPNAFFTTDVGQHQMWAAQFIAPKARHWLSSAGLGTMGYGLPAAIGAQIAYPDELVVCISGDASFQMNLQELGTIAQYNLPIKIVVVNNHWQGMVRQWQESFYEGRYSNSNMEIGAPDILQLAETYGIKGVRIDSNADLGQSLSSALTSEEPTLIEICVSETTNCYPMVQPGQSNSCMLGEGNIVIVSPDKLTEMAQTLKNRFTHLFKDIEIDEVVDFIYEINQETTQGLAALDSN